jgi:glycosyltransferase involved in cell wall biosynthesis
MSMAALESLASGVPVLAWNTPVYQQLIVNDLNGWLVPFADDKALAQGFCRALGTSIPERRQMGQRAVESMRPFDWERVVDHMEARLHDLCGMEPADRSPGRNAKP